MTHNIDPIALEIFQNLINSICEEMGEVLKRTAFSANIKERLDFSCAIFDHQGELVAQAAHIPVHLGNMGCAVKFLIELMEIQEPNTGDTFITNDPFNGGTHLPDITLITPVWHEQQEDNQTPLYYIANRAHHADIGGCSPGSMGINDSIQDEGVLIKLEKIKQNHQLNFDFLETLLEQVRDPEQRWGDLNAQMAALHHGEQEMQRLVKKYGVSDIRKNMHQILNYQDALTQHFIQSLPKNKPVSFSDQLEGDGFEENPLNIQVTIQRIGDTLDKNQLIIDWRETCRSTRGPVNATKPITWSAVIYTLTALMYQANLKSIASPRCIQLLTQPGSLVDAEFPSAVAAGNVETSQRLVDTLLGAFNKLLPGEIPAASCGSMNNFSFGGNDKNGLPYTYYETLAGGGGAHTMGPGLSARQSHMTNTQNTSIEILETLYPIRIKSLKMTRPIPASSLSAKPNSKRDGLHQDGGLGIEKEWEFLANAEVTLLNERHATPPYGLGGGENGTTGKAMLFRAGEFKALPSKISLAVSPGDCIKITTAGGGEWRKKG